VNLFYTFTARKNQWKHLSGQAFLAWWPTFCQSARGWGMGMCMGMGMGM